MDERTARSRHPDSIGQAFLWALLPTLVLVLSAPSVGDAQEVTTSITSTTGAGNLGTTITQTGNLYDITGGTRPGGGPNLFHSFGDFTVGGGDIANFLNNTQLPTSNILGRVTGGNVSNIFGTIQTTGFGNANLFLMNPAGFLFGPNATVNVGGMMTFTTADYLKLTDNARFNAIPNGAADALLTALPVASFGFLGSNPGAITVHGSQFSVTDGQSIALVGGNITIQAGTPDGGTAQPARLSAPNGKILLASAASPGEFDAATLQPLPNVNNTSFTSFGSASLAPGSNINVSGENTVSIRGGQFVLSVSNAVLSTADSAGAPATISLSPGSSIISSNAGADAGADVQLNASNVQMDGASIQSLTAGNGSGGNISITAALDGGPISSTAGSVQMKGGQIQTASLGPAKVGDIQINSSSLSMTDGALIDSLLVPNPLLPGQPAGGTITITVADSISVTGLRPGTTNLLPSVPGLPTFTNMQSGIYSVNVAANRGSDILVQTPKLTLQHGHIESYAFSTGAAGDATFRLGQLALENGASLSSVTFGDGATGRVQVAASESVTASGFLEGTFEIGSLVLKDTPSDIVTVAYGGGKASQVSVSSPSITFDGGAASSDSFGAGGAVGVDIHARTITLTGGAGISSSTFSSGDGGNISITASEQISMSGHSEQSIQIGSITFPPHGSGIGAVTLFGTGKGGTITVTTPTLTMLDDASITSATGGDGPGGSIIINANRINLSGGAIINGSSGFIIGDLFLIGNGPGGNIQLNATESLTITGHSALNPARLSGAITTAVGNGLGGDISVKTPNLLLQDGAVISAATQGPGRAGQILIDVTNATLDGGALISATTSGSGRGGTVTVNANTVTLASGGHLTAASTGPGTSGEVFVQGLDSPAQSVLIDGSGSGIFTNTSGAGTGGNIFVNANAVSLQNGAHVSSSSTGPGNTGNIQINAGNQFAMTNSSVTTEADHASGGTIKITTTPSGMVELTDSTISASVLDGTGGGGSVNIDPQFVILENSQILAQAKQGPGGNISITTNLLLPDANSVISASSQFGVNGTVTIQSPNAPGSGQVQPLGKTPLQATSLLNQHCAALAGGEFSSFTVVGRDSLPTEPGSWLASPLATLNAGTGLGAKGERREGGIPILSLRQIAPAGFLTQAFAVDWSGCTS